MSGHLNHSGHDYEALVEGWKAVCEGTGLDLGVIREINGLPVLKITNGAASARNPGGIYVSAGVHGDECAPVWALLEWAASKPEILRNRPVTLFPCLNPVGLIENTRRDGSGVDLNRSFTDVSQPVIAAWQESLEGCRFDVSVNLHEDYDATGIYLYELTRGESKGDRLLDACSIHLPRETAGAIDGSDFTNGLLVRTSGIEEVVAEQLGGGYPEAILLFLKYAAVSYTFETPSEADLSRRIAAHRTFLDSLFGPSV